MQKGPNDGGDETGRVVLHPVAGKYLNRLDARDRERVRKALKDLEKEPPEGNIKPVVGMEGHFRLTIGNYRAIFERRGPHIVVTCLDPRGQVYKKKNMGGKR